MTTSHPSWVRGLKHTTKYFVDCFIYVAPLVGAWIETNWRSHISTPSLRRTPRGCVD